MQECMSGIQKLDVTLKKKKGERKKMPKMFCDAYFIFRNNDLSTDLF